MADLKFLTQIMDTEQQADDLIVQANEKARETIDQARIRVTDIIREGREESAAVHKKILADAQQEADVIEKESLDQAQTQAHDIRTAAAARLDRAAKILAERIVNDHGHR